MSLVALGALWFMLGTPSAHAIPFLLDQDGCTGGCGTGSTIFGTVDVVQGGDADHVNVTVTLNSPSAFVSTGAGEALEFNISDDPSVTITNLATGFSVGPAPASAGIFGSFDYSISCGSSTVQCGPGASLTLPGPLTFTIAKTAGGTLSPTDFIANTDGFFFAADIIGPTGGTGNVATNDPPHPVPEPASLLLVGSGLAGLGAWGRKRRVKRNATL